MGKKQKTLRKDISIKDFKNILIISSANQNQIPCQFQIECLKKNNYKIFFCSTNKEEIERTLLKHEIEIICITSNIVYEERSLLCEWLFNKYPLKFYFILFCERTVLNVLNDLPSCNLLKENKCKASFLYLYQNEEFFISRFESLIKKSLLGMSDLLKTTLKTILDNVVEKVGIIPLKREEIQKYGSIEEVYSLVNSILDRISKKTKEFLVKFFNLDKMSLFLYDSLKENYVLVASYKYKILKTPTVLERDWFLVKKAIKDKKPMLLQNGFMHYPEFKKLKIKHQPEIISSIILPLKVGDYIMGVINMARLSPLKEKFTKLDFYLAKVYSEWLSYIFSILLSFKNSLEYEKLKSDFVSIINHELRTPLMALSGAVELLEGEIPKNIEDILKRNIKRLDSLILNLLDFSKIGKGTFKVILKFDSIKDLVSEIVEEYKIRLEKLGIKFIVEEELITEKIFFDKDRIKQIITNFLNNSIKFAKEDEKNKYIKFTIKEEEKYIHFIVEDNGIGIKKEDLKRIFMPFVQVGDIMTEHKPGLGLGLFISKEIAQQHKGKIFAESEYGKFTRFHLLLPKYLGGEDKS